MKKNVPRKKKPPEKEPRTVLQLTRKQFLVWGGITFFAMAWMFVLGILVGRGRSPVRFDVPKIKGELATLKDKVLPTEQAGAGNEEETISAEQDLEFFKALREKQEEPKFKVAKTLEAPEEPGISRVAPRAASPVPEVTSPPQEVKEPELEPEVKPAPPEAGSAGVEIKRALPKTAWVPPRGPETALRRPLAKTGRKEVFKPEERQPAERFTVEIAAFKNVDRARQLIVYLTRKGYHAYQATAHSADRGTYHRVCVGPFPTEEDAFRTASSLRKNEIEAVVVPE